MEEYLDAVTDYVALPQWEDNGSSLAFEGAAGLQGGSLFLNSAFKVCACVRGSSVAQV